MPKRFLLATAFIWIFLGFVIPNSINPNDANIFAELLGVIFIRTLTAILLAGIIELGFVISKSFRSRFSSASKSEKDQKTTEPAKVTFPVGSKEWRADSDNIYYQRNLWAVLDFLIYFAVSMIVASFLALPTMWILTSTSLKDSVLDLGSEVVSLLFVPLIFVILDAISHRSAGGSWLFTRYGKLKIVNQNESKPGLWKQIVRPILKLLIIPAIIWVIPGIVWLLAYFIFVEDKSAISPIDMVLGTKAVKVEV